MLVKEEYAEQYCRKRLKCTEDGGKCRTDASYSRKPPVNCTL